MNPGNLHLHRRYSRRWSHFDAYSQGEDYYLVEAGSWTLEFESKVVTKLVRSYHTMRKTVIVLLAAAVACTMLAGRAAGDPSDFIVEGTSSENSMLYQAK